MAYSSAQLSTAELAYAAADKPLIMGSNALRNTAMVTPEWRTTADWASGTDHTDSDGPTSYLSDEFDHLQSYPDASYTFVGLIFDFSTTLAEFDSVALLNCTGMEDVRIRIQIDDNNDFSTAIELEDTTVSSTFEGRFFDLVMKESGDPEARRYSDVRYFRILFNHATGAVPKIGEIVLSRRRQLKAHPAMPFHENRLRTTRARFESASGVISDYVYRKGQRVLPFTINPHEDTYINDLKSLWETDTDFGSLPFVYVDNPNSGDQDGYWMSFEDSDLIGPIVGYTERSFNINAIERGPNFLKLES